MQNELRSLSSSAAKVNAMMGLMLYRNLCSQQASFISEHGGVDINSSQFNDEEYESGCIEGLGYYIEQNNLFSTWLAKGIDFDVSDVMDACNALNRLSTYSFKKSAGYITENLHTSLSKLGFTAKEQTQHLVDILYSIDELSLDSVEEISSEFDLLINDFCSQNSAPKM